MLAQSKTVREKPDLVKSFVEASIEGWYSYIYGDPSPGNAAIRAANPDMTQASLDNAIAAMKSYGIVDSGDSEKLGIGAMTGRALGGVLPHHEQRGAVSRDAGLQARVHHGNSWTRRTGCR